MEEIKVSVIVPVYNVQDYLSECVESIINQSYKNLEIILVDDGSTDESGKICDDYADKDSRIKVIHKQNGGLSDARNTGLAYSEGAYVAYIDSDDYVSKYFVEFLMRAILENDADLVVIDHDASFWDDEDYRPKLSNRSEDYMFEISNKDEILEDMLLMKIPTGAPDKFCKREIWEKNLFPVGYLYEDLATTYKLFIDSEKVALVKSDITAYRKRKDSIIRQDFTERKLISIEITKQLTKDIKNYNTDLYWAAQERAFAFLFSVFLQIPNEQVNTQLLVWKEILRYRGWLFKGLKNKKARLKDVLAVVCTFLGMKISYFLGRKYGQKGTMYK